jgi:ornithine cyclodeaminase/alanine dehydrogenase-like protein (mu-crystallin family)
MAIILRESEIEELATMQMALDVVEQAFRLKGEGQAENAPRRRCRLEKGFLHVMSASLPTLGVAGLKSYTTSEGKARFLVYLHSAVDGKLLAVMEANKLGQIRTGAASGVAARYMARKSSSRLGIIGSGWQARAQLEGICAVLPIETITAYSPTAEKLEAFCSEMTAKLGMKVHPAATPEEASRDKDVVVTATTAKEPVLKGEWLAEGTHVTAIGANFLTRRELDLDVVRRSACVIVDSSEQAMLESGDLAPAVEAGEFYWEDARELAAVVTGEYPGREDDREITLFKSHGIGLEDVALAARIYAAATKARIGEKLDL